MRNLGTVFTLHITTLYLRESSAAVYLCDTIIMAGSPIISRQPPTPPDLILPPLMQTQTFKSSPRYLFVVPAGISSFQHNVLEVRQVLVLAKSVQRT